MFTRIKTAHLLLAMVLCLLVPVTAGATNDIDLYMGNEINVSVNEISVFIDGEKLEFDVAPTIVDGSTLVPVTVIFQALGASVTWDGDARTVTAKRGEMIVELVIDQKEARVNGNPVTLDVPASIISGRTFVPLRFVSQAFDATVKWDGATRTVNISRPVSVTSLTLAPAELSLRSGQTGQISATAVLADGKQEKVEGAAMSWRSANTAVATVEDGVVTGTGPGNTVLTASYEGVSFGIMVKVDESLSGIVITPANLSMEMGDKNTLALMACYTDLEQQSIPADRANWRSSNSKVATISGGEITAVTPGTATITAVFHNYEATAIVEVFRDMPVTFHDVELHAAILNELNKPAGPLYRSELAKLTKLEANDRLIEDLRGIEYCTNLRSLSLAGNHIRDISPLAGLKALERLELGYNQVIDLRPLAALQQLSWLSLNNNRVSDISELAGLTELRWLSLASNEISSISALESLQKMRTLNVSGNRINSLGALAETKGLITLHFWNNEVRDLSPLADLPNLTTINAWSNNISNISPLAGLPDLSWLAIGDNPLDLTSSSPVMTELRRLRGRGVYVRTDTF